MLFNFPYYPFRQYDSLEVEGSLVLLNTIHDTYVVKDNSIECDDYLKMRVQMLYFKDYDHPVYPITQTVWTLAGLRKYANKHVIDCKGNIMVYKPQRFYKVHYYKITDIEAFGNYTYFKLQGFDKPVLSYLPGTYMNKYAGVVEIGGCYIVYDLSLEFKDSHRVKL